ncbi:hypothetical protein [Paraburkholderia sp. WP4_3_2]|uniref:hypothetical protein n=1 Tax=Paraburkholderia sp. WP4_3_2 TaxID=2587162 RepID=UPI0016185042|nr:hypothetical protein [Paraburkholderia sp. WP4_3_2]MBB3256891.1 hypothetical protein [Paraburkholderia sp. WP4_3_2]
MKVTIEASGNLLITPETGCEAYALGHWAEENLGPVYKDVTANAPAVKIRIDCSDFPEALPPIVLAERVVRL